MHRYNKFQQNLVAKNNKNFQQKVVVKNDTFNKNLLSESDVYAMTYINREYPKNKYLIFLKIFKNKYNPNNMKAKDN